MRLSPPVFVFMYVPTVFLLANTVWRKPTNFSTRNRASRLACDEDIPSSKQIFRLVRNVASIAPKRERERERERERQRQRQKETETERQRKRERERDRDRETERQRQRDR